MRLRLLQGLLEKPDYAGVKLKFSHNINSNTYTIKNINAFKGFIENIKQIDIFSKEVSVIFSSVLYRTTQDELTIPANQLDFSNDANYLLQASESLSRVLTKLIGPQDPLIICVKLPEPENLKELLYFMSLIEKSTSPILLDQRVKGTLKVANWEIGSLWIDFWLGSLIAVSFFAYVAWAAVVIAKKIKECEIIEEHVRSLTIKNESLEDVLEKQKELTRMLVDTEARNICNNLLEGEDNGETIERVKFAIDSFATLIQKGAEIHPSLTAPEKVQNLFPDFSKLESITSKTKLITTDSISE